MNNILPKLFLIESSSWRSAGVGEQRVWMRSCLLTLVYSRRRHCRHLLCTFHAQEKHLGRFGDIDDYDAQDDPHKAI